MKDLLSRIKKDDYVSITGKVPRSLKMKMESILDDNNLNINQYIKHMAETLVSGKSPFEEKESEFKSIISTKNSENNRLSNRINELESLLRNSNDNTRKLKNKIMEIDFFEKDFSVKEKQLKEEFERDVKAIHDDCSRKIFVLNSDIDKLKKQVELYKNLTEAKKVLRGFNRENLNDFVLEINEKLGTKNALIFTKTSFFKSLKEAANKNNQ